MLDFRIYSFLAVCKHLSYTRAAQELNLTQPAITQHIQYLQKQYQVKFFTRENNQLFLTPEGEIFRNAMLMISQTEKKIQDDLRNAYAEKHIIRFGATKIIAEYELSHSLSAYLKAYPDRHIQLMVEDTPILLQQLDEGLLHFAIVDSSFPRNKYQSIHWSTEESIFVCSGACSISGMRIHLQDLLANTLIVYTANPEANDMLLNLLADKGITLSDFNRTIEINDLNAIKQLVTADCGIAFLPKKVVAAELADDLLREIPVSNCNMFQEFNFIWVKDSIDEYAYRFMYSKLHDMDTTIDRPRKRDL